MLWFSPINKGETVGAFSFIKENLMKNWLRFLSFLNPLAPTNEGGTVDESREIGWWGS